MSIVGDSAVPTVAALVPLSGHASQIGQVVMSSFIKSLQRVVPVPQLLLAVQH